MDIFKRFKSYFRDKKYIVSYEKYKYNKINYTLGISEQKVGKYKNVTTKTIQH